ncbi:hypothetical protein Avbf_18527 [Armadillidium vulgare]|nr:hypothetical protein Avbf_18527 [Armadillidium vulgare]
MEQVISRDLIFILMFISFPLVLPLTGREGYLRLAVLVIGYNTTFLFHFLHRKRNELHLYSFFLFSSMMSADSATISPPYEFAQIILLLAELLCPEQ